jgi:predicted  nucleic acid-binding Zn-ribbon protein
MGVSDSAKKLISDRVEVIKDQIARINTMIEDYDQRIQVLQTARTQEVQKKKELEKQLADLKGDINANGQGHGI